MVSPWAAFCRPGVNPIIDSLTSGDVVVRVPSLQTCHGGGCEPCALVGFGPVLVPTRGSVAKGVAVSFGVYSRDVRQPVKPDATRTLTIVLGLRRTR